MLKKVCSLLFVCFLPFMWLAASAAGETKTYLPVIGRYYDDTLENVALVVQNSADLVAMADLLLARPDGSLTTLLKDISADGYTTFSPNGVYFTYSSFSTRVNYVVEVENPENIVALNQHWRSYYQWLPDNTALWAYKISYSAEPDAMFLITIPDFQEQSMLIARTDSAAWSPDSTWLAYSTSFTETLGIADIYRMERDGSGRTPLYAAPTDDNVLQVLTDGMILFTVGEGSDNGASSDIYRMNSDGSQVHRLTETSYAESQIYLSPDERTIVYRASNDTGAVMDIEGNLRFEFPIPCALGFCYLSEVEWTPDGSEIYFVYIDQFSTEFDFAIYWLPTDGSQTTPQMVREGAVGMEMSDDGRYLGYTVGMDDARRVAILDLVTKRESVIPSDTAMSFGAWRPRN